MPQSFGPGVNTLRTAPVCASAWRWYWGST